MTPIDALKKIQKFTVENIAPLINLQKEQIVSGNVMDDTEDPIEYVHPNVEIGTMPHKNFQPLDFQTPMILWTIDEVSDEGTYAEGRILNMRAYVSTYGGDVYKQEENGTRSKIPDNKAYLDLMNCLEIMYIELSKAMNIEGLAIHKPFSYAPYDGAFYPYAYGYFTLSVEILNVEYEGRQDCISQYL